MSGDKPEAADRGQMVNGSAEGGARSAAVLAGIGLAEAAALGGLALAGQFSIGAAIGLHVLAIAGLAGHLASLHRRKAELTAAMLGVVATAVLGPPGAIGAAVVSSALRGRTGPDRLLQDWYDRIALATEIEPVSKLSDTIRVGRAVGVTGPAPQSFQDVVEEGPLASRQAVLGHIARHFDPDYLATLQAALKSPIPSIRVQAAAVAAHLQPEVRKAFAAAVAAVPAASAHPAEALVLLRTLDALEASGLLDEGERKRARAVASRLGDIVLSAVASYRPVIASGIAVETRRGLEETVERLLVERCRFAELRAWRSSARLGERFPKARLRRIGSAAGRAAA